MPVPSSWHPGEIAAQQARGFEDAAWGRYTLYEEGAPSFMADFLSSLPFLSITTLDEQGMPWPSLICNDGQNGFLQLEQSEPTSRFKCTIQAPVGVPIRDCLLRLQTELSNGKSPYDEMGEIRPEFQLAAVGVMLHNRRRNKMQGVIVSVEEAPKNEQESTFTFRIDVTNTFGNCPKYINTRHLVPLQGHDQSTPSSSGGDGSYLPPDILSIIASADMLFIATKHSGSSDVYPVDLPILGNNIRGGPPGFLRAYFDEEVQRHVIILPDWSGNRLMQSFGNMTNDPVAGIVIPIWSTKTNRKSDLLHITCDALVLASEEAGQLIRGVQGAVKLWPQRWSLVLNSLPLIVAGGDIGWSPYNPPVRLLNSEKPSLSSNGISRPTASLVRTQFYSPIIATFVFQLDTPIAYEPGQHIILDCNNILDTRIHMYTHMAQFRGGEKDLNDDGTRSWTISYASPVSTNALQQFEVTLRRQERGGVTPGLFRRGWLFRKEGLDSGELSLEVLGVGGFSLLSLEKYSSTDALHLGYLVSGIGLTPMLPHLSLLAHSKLKQARVLAVAAVKWNEIGVTRQLIRRALSRTRGCTINLHVQVFFLAGVLPDGLEEAAEMEEEGEELSSNITLEEVVLRGKRLQPHSLTMHRDQSKDVSNGDFVMPDEACKELQRASQIVICAGSAFSRIAGESLKQANIPDDKVKMESFSF